MGRSSQTRSLNRPWRRGAAHAAAFAALLALLLSATATTAAPVTGRAGDTVAPDHVTVINGPASMRDWTYAVVADDGGAYVGGFVARTSRNRDASLARVSSSGELEWLETYDGPFHGQDRLLALARGPRGTVYGAGFTWARGRGLDMLVVKWRADGTRVWARTYDRGHGSDDVAVALGVDADGDVTVAGSSDYFNQHGVVVRWTAAGRRSFVWPFKSSLSGGDAADVLVRADGTAYVTTSAVLAGSPDRETALTVKFSPSGKKLWQKLYAGPDGLGAHATAITGRPGGGVYVAGWTSTAEGSDGFVVRYAGSGAPRVLPPVGPSGGAFWDVAVTASGSIVAVGDATVRVWTSETAASVDGGGDLQAGDEFYAVAPDAVGGFYAAGEADAPSAGRFLVQHDDPAAGGYRSVWPSTEGLAGRVCALAVGGTTAYAVGTYLDWSINLGEHRPSRDDQLVLIYRD